MAKEETILLLNFNGTNNSTTFIEETGKIITTNGDVKILTDQSVFGGSSGYFDGTGDSISFNTQGNAWDFSRGDWTLECWVYLKDTTSRALFVPRNTVYFPFGFFASNSNHLYAYASAGSGWNVAITGTSTIPINTWTHIAFVRYGNLFISFINGVVDGTAVSSGDLMAFPSTSYIGTDTGAYNSNFYGYIDSFRLIKGRALYTEAFTVPTEQPQYDSYYKNYVSLLIPFDGPNNSTVFGDYSPNRIIITKSGTLTISTTQSKFGGSSCYFNSSGYLYPPFPTNQLNFGTNDHTVEAWIYPSGSGSPLINCQYSSNLWNFYLDSSTSGRLLLSGSNFITGVSFTANTWQHLAIVRFGNIWTVYVDGISKGTGTNSGTFDCSNTCYFGGYPGGHYFTGYVDSIRITNGIARYTGNFTPPTQAFYQPNNYDPFLDKVSLLLHMDGDNNSTTFKDSSANNASISVFGNAKISTTQNKTGGTSGYFDGNGDYLTLNYSSLYQLEDTSFTIECWVYPLVSNTRIGICGTKPLSGNTGWVWHIQADNTLRLFYTGGSVVTSSGTISANIWTHLAVVRNGTTVTHYINGVASGSGTVSNGTPSTSSMLVIGAENETPTTQFFNGYIDELRLTKGVARYLTDFTPPAYRFYDLITQIEYFYGVYNDIVICNPGESIGDFRNNSRVYIDNNLYFDTVDYGEINIQGYYKIDKTPVHRKIRLCTYPNHFIIRETWSDPITGLYSFNNVKKQNYILIFEDYENLHHSKIRRLFVDQM